MQTINKNDVIPDNVELLHYEGDTIKVYFADDQEVIDAKNKRELIQSIVNRTEAKQSRAESVKNITVTTLAGNAFDGDETSQDRMTRAITAMEGLPVETTTLWVLSDNTAVQVTRDELKEALLLAGQAQSNIWVIE